MNLGAIVCRIECIKAKDYAKALRFMDASIADAIKCGRSPSALDELLDERLSIMEMAANAEKAPISSG